MMTRPEPPEEICARELLSRALGVHVSSHDDGSRDSMYDLSIHRPGGDEPVEVVTVQNPGYIRFSDALNRRERRLPAPDLRHQWMAGLRHSARVKNLEKVLVGELSKLEEKHELTGGFVPVPDVLARHGVYYLSVGDYADDEPEWDVSVDSIAYVTDQKHFPRDEEHQPEWLKAKLAEGRVRIAERDAREARERGD